MKKIIALIIMAAMVIGVCFYLSEMEYQDTVFALNTNVVITAKGFGSQAAVKAAVERVKELDGQLSAHLDSSDVWKINNGSEKWGQRDTIRVINRGIYFSKLSGGVFDVTIMPLVRLWKENSEPTGEEIEAAQALVDYTLLQENNALPPDMAIDLGGIAKGFVADEIAVALRKNGIKSAIIDAGGNVLAMGDEPCVVGIQTPFASSGQYVGTVTVSDKTVVTSGLYERGMHIIDPRTGRPVENEVLSATVICDVSMDADALSTILFILGEDGFQILEQYGAEGILINKAKQVKTTKGADFIITDSTYTMGD